MRLSNASFTESSLNITDDNFKASLESKMVVIFLGFLSVVGIVGNGLVLCVYGKKKDKKTHNILILSLAWCDFFACLVLIPLNMVSILRGHRLVFDVICKLNILFDTGIIPFSGLLMVAVAAERYLSICHPFSVLFTPFRAWVCVAFLCLASLSLGAIVSCTHGVYSLKTSPVYNCSTNTSDKEAMDTNSPLEYFSSSSDANRPLNSSGGEGSLVRTYHLDAPCVLTHTETSQVYNNGGLCSSNNILIPFLGTRILQILVMSVYLLSVVVVSILYVLIFREVVRGRMWRKKITRPLCETILGTDSTVETIPNLDGHMFTGQSANLASNEVVENLVHSPPCDDDVDDNVTTRRSRSPGNLSTSSSGRRGKQTTKEEFGPRPDRGKCPNSAKPGTRLQTCMEGKTSDVLANIRTASMLFVVTVVYVLCFLPACLMALRILKWSMFIFYCYFINNVANPFIYAFMNKNFRLELKMVFQRKKRSQIK